MCDTLRLVSSKFEKHVAIDTLVQARDIIAAATRLVPPAFEAAFFSNYQECRLHPFGTLEATPINSLFLEPTFL